MSCIPDIKMFVMMLSKVTLLTGCQGPNVLEEVDLIEMGITNAAHRTTILHAASKYPPVPQTGLVIICF